MKAIKENPNEMEIYFRERKSDSDYGLEFSGKWEESSITRLSRRDRFRSCFFRNSTFTWKNKRRGINVMRLSTHRRRAWFSSFPSSVSWELVFPSPARETGSKKFSWNFKQYSNIWRSIHMAKQPHEKKVHVMDWQISALTQWNMRKQWLGDCPQ
jgi:hypothetical protein